MLRILVVAIILISTFGCKSTSKSIDTSKVAATSSIDNDFYSQSADGKCRDWSKTFSNKGTSVSKIFEGDEFVKPRVCALAIENGIENAIQKDGYQKAINSCDGTLTCSTSTADGSDWGVMEDPASYQPLGEQIMSPEGAEKSCIIGKQRAGQSELYMQTGSTIVLIKCECQCVD